MTRDQVIEVIAKGISKLCGIEPVDSTDGSPNWWLFHEDATKLVKSLEERGFGHWDKTDEVTK
jgi:hypothetical protein